MKKFVIKMGGEIIDHPAALNTLCQEIAKIAQAGIKIILIHGGGKQATEWEQKLGRIPTIIKGRRVTDENTLETLKMIFSGKINIEILSTLQSNGLNAVGLSGVDANTVKVHRRPPKKNFNEITQTDELIDYGLVGDITTINSDLLYTLIEKNYIPVVAPLASDDKGILYNVNADNIAQAIALAIGAEKLILLTNVDGIYDQQKNIISHLTCEQAYQLIANGTITKGMIPKVESSLSAIHNGMPAVHIMNGFKPSEINSLLFHKPVGTLITHETSNYAR